MARRSFTLEFKTSAAKLVREQGYSVAQAAQSLGVDPRSIRDWVARFAPQPQFRRLGRDPAAGWQRRIEAGSRPSLQNYRTPPPSGVAMWSPISLEELSDQITASLAQMEDGERLLWDLVRVPPLKWRLHPWGDLGGGFWVVGIIGCQVIWYNDIEHGFNVSRYEEAGTIAKYWCSQDELHHVIWQLRQQIESGGSLGRFGPPEKTDEAPEADA